jgi:flagellar protein FliL
VAEDTKAEAGAAPKKSSKMMIIILAAVVVLGGGGAAFYLMSRGGHDDEEAAAPKAAAKGAVPTFLPIDTMVVNLADPGGEKVAQVGVSLMLSDIKAVDIVKPYLPAIRSAILLKVSERTAEELLQREGKDKLAEDILDTSIMILSGEEEDDPPKSKRAASKGKKKSANVEVIRKVLFTSFIVQ